MKKIVLAVLLCCVFGVASSNADERQEEKTTAGQAWMDTAEGQAWKEWKNTPEGKGSGFWSRSRDFDLQVQGLTFWVQEEGEKFWGLGDMQGEKEKEENNL